MQNIELDRIDQLLQQVDSLPPAPQMLPRLLSALTAQDTDLTQLVDLVSFDPALTAKLLQTCNSAYFSGARPVNDVFEAVSRLGFKSVYRVVAVVTGGQCLRPARPGGLDAAQLWRHSVTTGFAAQFVGEDRAADGGMLFTAGIFHDIGKVVLASVPPVKTSGAGFEPDEFDIGSLHAEVGARLLERWKFSPALVNTVRFHHAPWAAREVASLAACVCLADALAHSLEQNQGGDPMSRPEPQSAVKLLDLAPNDLPRYQELLKENLEFVEALCRAQG